MLSIAILEQFRVYQRKKQAIKNVHRDPGLADNKDVKKRRLSFHILSYPAPPIGQDFS